MVLNALVNTYSNKWFWNNYSCVIRIHTHQYILKCQLKFGGAVMVVKHSQLVSVMKTEELLGTHLALLSVLCIDHKTSYYYM